MATPARSKPFTWNPGRVALKSANPLICLAPEGYGEICGGSERMSDHDAFAGTHPRSKACPKKPSSGIWNCVSMALSPIRDSAWAWNESLPGYAASSISAKRSRSRGRSRECIRKVYTSENQKVSRGCDSLRRLLFISKCIYGMINTCPTLILLMFVILLAEAIAATVVPYLIAITVKFSPDFTV